MSVIYQFQIKIGSKNRLVRYRLKKEENKWFFEKTPLILASKMSSENFDKYQTEDVNDLATAKLALRWSS